MRPCVAAALAAVAAAYTCDLASSKPFVAGAFPTVGLTPGQLLAAAAAYGSGPALRATKYAYTSVQNGVTMSFTTDCSCWVNFLTEQFAPAAYAAVTKDTTVQPPVPRAANWTTYFAGLSPQAASPWTAVADVRSVQAGDVLAYKLPPGSTDTGMYVHVVEASEPPSRRRACCRRARHCWRPLCAALVWCAVS